LHFRLNLERRSHRPADVFGSWQRWLMLGARLWLFESRGVLKPEVTVPSHSVPKLKLDAFAWPLHYSDFRLHIPVLASLAFRISLSSELKTWIICDLTQIPPLRSNPRSSRSALGCLYWAASSIVHMSLRVKYCPPLDLLLASLPILNPSHRPLQPCTCTCNERLSGYDRFTRSLFKFPPAKPCKRRLDPGCMATE